MATTVQNMTSTFQVATTAPTERDEDAHVPARREVGEERL